MAYVVVVTGEEARSAHNTIVAHAGIKWLVIEERDGWVEATATHLIVGADGMISNLWGNPKLFDTAEKAKAFVSKWKGHPWYCIPSGEYSIIEVEPVHERVLSGYRAVSDHNNQTLST